MKPPSLLLTLLIPAASFAQGWAPEGARWTYTQGSWSGPDTNLAIIERMGDTLINGLVYERLQATEGAFLCSPIYEYLHYDGDSLWFLDDPAGTPQLLWCMNAVPGDSWQTPLRYEGIPVDTITWWVLDTTHITAEGVQLRQLLLYHSSATMALTPTCTGPCLVTERLGDHHYFFDFPNGSCDAETFLGLRCYADSAISWLAPPYTQCTLDPGPGAPFVPTGAVWSYNGMHLEDHGVMMEVPHVGQYTCIGDTLFQGRHCSVLGEGPAWWLCNYKPSLLNLRGDTVFYFSGLDSTFKVLYVMDTPVGGSWTARCPEPNNPYWDVTWTRGRHRYAHDQWGGPEAALCNKFGFLGRA